MSTRTYRNNVVLLGCLVAAVAVCVPLVNAQDRSAGESVEARAQALAELSPEARRAELKAMSAEERRELWFAVKRSQGEPLAKGTGLEPRTMAGGPKAAPGGGPEKLVGSIVYDDGVITTSFGGGAIVGNHFDTATGNPLLASGTISTVVGVVLQGPSQTTDSAGFVIEGPQTMGGGAFAIFSTFTNGLTATTETVTFSGLGVSYTGSSFFVLFGDFANSYVPAFGTGTTQGQGHHGVVGYTGGMGPNITSTFDFGDTLNGLVRVTGNVLPVELMSFEVE